MPKVAHPARCARYVRNKLPFESTTVTSLRSKTHFKNSAVKLPLFESGLNSQVINLMLVI